MLNRRRWLAAAGSLTAGVLCLPGQALAGLLHRRRCVPVPPCCPAPPTACEPPPEAVVYSIFIRDPGDLTTQTRPFPADGTYSSFYGGPLVELVIQYPGTSIPQWTSGRFPVTNGGEWSYSCNPPNATPPGVWAQFYALLWASPTATTPLASDGARRIIIR